MCCARPCVRVCACSGRAACAVSHMAPQQCVCAPRLIALPMAAEPACASCVSLEPCTVCCLVLGNAPAPACTCVCVANARLQHAKRSILLFIDTRSHPRRGIAAEASTVPTHPPDLCQAPHLTTKQPHSCSPPHAGDGNFGKPRNSLNNFGNCQAPRCVSLAPNTSFRFAAPATPGDAHNPPVHATLTALRVLFR